jgi:hypothetical protein
MNHRGTEGTEPTQRLLRQLPWNPQKQLQREVKNLLAALRWLPGQRVGRVASNDAVRRLKASLLGGGADIALAGPRP